MQRNPFLDDDEDDDVITVPRGFTRQQKYGLSLLMMLLTTILGFTGLLLLREPISKFFAIEKLKEQKRLEQQDLEEDLELLAYSVGSRMTNLSQYMDRLFLDFERVTGIPYATAHEYAPPRIDRAILKSDSFAEFWSSLLNARILYDEVTDKQNDFNRIRDRVESGRVTRLDQLKLIELAEWTQRHANGIMLLHQRLDQIRNEIGLDPIEHEIIINHLEPNHDPNNN